MPFDATGFPHEPRQPRRSTRSDSIVSAAIVLIALGLLVTPISLAAFIDLVRYLRGH
jgi:hypothetical protein